MRLQNLTIVCMCMFVGSEEHLTGLSVRFMLKRQKCCIDEKNSCMAGFIIIIIGKGKCLPDTPTAAHYSWKTG